VPVVAVSVDPPEVSREWAEKKGFSFVLASDPEQSVIEGQYHIQNPDSPNLAIHAVYLLEPDGTIFYRKIGRRRPKTKELLYALDRKALFCCPGSCGEVACDFEGADAAPG
jgi:peroxiredoxin